MVKTEQVEVWSCVKANKFVQELDQNFYKFLPLDQLELWKEVFTKI